MDPQIFAPLGVYAVTLLVMAYFIKYLMGLIKELRQRGDDMTDKMLEDQKEQLPVLQSVLAAMTEMNKTNERLLERERRQ